MAAPQSSSTSVCAAPRTVHSSAGILNRRSVHAQNHRLQQHVSLGGVSGKIGAILAEDGRVTGPTNACRRWNRALSRPIAVSQGWGENRSITSASIGAPGGGIQKYALLQRRSMGSELVQEKFHRTIGQKDALLRTGRKVCRPPQASLDADLSEQLSGQRKESNVVNRVLGLGVLVAADQALQAALPTGGLPSALVGCLLLTSALLLLDQASQPAARDVIAFFGPASEFLQRWLPLFFTPAIVLLPRLLRNVSITEGIKMVLVLVAGLLVSFAQAGGLATLVRNVKPSGRLRSAEHMANVAPYTLTELIPWAALTAGAGLVYFVSPTLAGSEALTAAPCLIGATVTGFLLSAWLPGPLKRLVHPSIVAAAVVNAVAIVGGQSLGRSWESLLGLYSTGSIRSPGAADILSSFMGPALLALAFTLHRQRRLIRDHLPELAVVIPVSALLSLFSMAFLGRRLNLDPTLSSSLAGRFVNPPIASLLAPLIGGDTTVMTGACVLTGVLGSNLNRWLLSLFRFNDPVARALAVSCSSHVLGSAALAAKDDDLLPFAQVAYTLMALVTLGACSSTFVTGQLARLAGG